MFLIPAEMNGGNWRELAKEEVIVDQKDLQNLFIN